MIRAAARVVGWAAAVGVLVVGFVGHDATVGTDARELLRAYGAPAAGGAPLAFSLTAGQREGMLRLWLDDPAWGGLDDHALRAARVRVRLVTAAGEELFVEAPWISFRR